MSSTSFIISASESDGNWGLPKTHRLKSQLAMGDLSSVLVQGTYKGQREVSLFVIPGPQPYEEARKAVLQAAANFNQESVLEINNEGLAWLVFINGKQKFLGPVVTTTDLPPWVNNYTVLPDGTFMYTPDAPEED